MYMNFPGLAWSVGPLIPEHSIITSREVGGTSEKAEDDGDDLLGTQPGTLTPDGPFMRTASS